MESDFEEELERGKEKIAALHKKAKSDQQEMEQLAEEARLEFFEYFGLDDFPNLKAWPSELDDSEKALFKRFITALKEKLPKAVPFLRELTYRSREVFEASESDEARVFFGQYRYTDFVTSAVLEIPSFSSIKIYWEGQFNHDILDHGKDIEVRLVYSYERTSTGTKMIYWEEETDWDVVLVRAKEQADAVAKARQKGFLELK